MRIHQAGVISERSHVKADSQIVIGEESNSHSFEMQSETNDSMAGEMPIKLVQSDCHIKKH